jgi:uncharacterized phiE125 gp8 family phage protein
MRLELVTAPAAEPLTLAEAKVHLRAPSGSSEDALITRLIAAARLHIEAITRRRLITQKWRAYFDRFPCGSAGLVLVDLTPVTAIDLVKYIDTAGAEQTLASSVYQLVPGMPARLYLAFDQSWPDIRGDRDSVRVEVTSGYGAAAAVPADLIAAHLMLLAHWYENREAVNVGNIVAEMPLSVADLLAPYVVPEF